MPPFDQPLDQLNDHADVLAGPRLVIGAAQAQPIRIGHVGGGHLLGQPLASAGPLAGRRIDLVVDVRDVCYKSGSVAFMDQKTVQQREDHERTGVADMDAAVHRRTAHVKSELPRVMWLERTDLAGAGVVKGDRAQSGPTLAPASAAKSTEHL